MPDTVEQLGDTEAEAALLALGPHLEWTSEASGWHSFFDEDSARWYDIVRARIDSPRQEDEQDRLHFFPIFLDYEGNQGNQGNHSRGGIHETLEAAKADCEHHYTTGQWQMLDEHCAQEGKR